MRNVQDELLYFIEKIDHLKINRARLRKTLRKTHLKINRKVPAQGPLDSLGRASDDPRTTLGRPSDDPRTALGRPWTTWEDPRTTVERHSNKTKCVSNDRSHHDDQFRPRIVKIGAILDYF